MVQINKDVKEKLFVIMYHLVPMPTSFEIKDVDDGAR
jgi:hypothetical protein